MRRTTYTLVLAVVIAGATVAAPSGAAAGPVTELDPDTVLLRIDLGPDGTADWHVEYRVELDGPNETQAFQDYRRDVEADPATYRERFRQLMRTPERKAENATGREMALGNVSVNTERRGPPPTGVVVYEFEWRAFAAANETTIRAGDALSEFYANEETTLMLTWPDEYRRASVQPSPDSSRSGVVVWEGPMQFAPDEPRLRLIARDAVETSTPPTTDRGADEPGEASDDDPTGLLGESVPLAGAGLVALATVGLVGWTLARRGSLPLVGGTADSAGASEAGPPPELMSNEERVLATLESNGGRLKQHELADELGWKAPKTSKVVQDLREAEEVTVFRLGRENVVSLPDADPRDGGG